MGKLFIAEDASELNPAPRDWIWIKPSTGEIFENQDGSWVLRATLSLGEHSHPEHGDINFTGSVSADGDEGLTGERIVQGYTLTFKKGLLVGFQAP